MKYLVAILLVLLVGSLGMYQASVYGDSIDWTSVELSKKESEFTNEMDNSFGLCKQANSVDIVSDLEYMDGATLPYKGCIIEGQDVDMYVSPLMDISSGHPRNFAIRTKPNGKFYFMKPGTITNMQHAQLIPGTNIYTEWRYTPYDSTLVRAMDIREAIVADKFDSMGNPIRYAFDESSISVKTRSFVNDNGPYLSGALTRDGKFLFWSMNGLLYKINLDTGVRDVKYMPGQDINWQNVPYYSRQIFPVDSEGRYVFLGGKLDMLVDTADCGQYYVEIDFMGIPEQVMAEQTNCKMRSFKGLVNTESGFGTGVFGVKIEGSKLQIGTYRAMPDGSKRFMVEFSPEGLNDTQTFLIDYLALGDSYSSGEGDNGIFFGDKYYRKGTDESGPPLEKCHISTRSYPYLLANTQKLESNKWNTVACSGALVGQDYSDRGSNNYFGQAARLGGLSSEQISQYQADAKESFIPGRVRQIEFVKKYKPKVITITGTGNDANFEPIIKACVSPSLSDKDTEDTCSYAGDSRGISILGRGIERQYDNIRNLLQSMKHESPKSQIYYVGYPQFLKASDKTCGLGVSLSIKERKVFREATTYLNRVIKAAAESEGAIFVDIEKSLDGHQLCEDNPYVTGYNADCGEGIVKWFRGKDECQESFHPKSDGHALIASKILTKHPDIMHDNPCKAPLNCVNVTELSDVNVPNIFTDAYAQDAKANRVPVKGGVELVAQKGNEDARISTSTDELQSNSTANSYLTSEPVSLGILTVGSNGVLTIDKAVPDNVPAGYHTLHIEGVSKTGEPLELWWIIRIFGKDGDVDEDGIPDDIDKCIFMPTLNIDKDGDDIDDGCDSDVNGIGLAQRTEEIPLGSVATFIDKRLVSNINSTKAVVDSDNWMFSRNHEIYQIPKQLSLLDTDKPDSQVDERGDGSLPYWIALVILAIITMAIYTVIKWRAADGKSRI